MSAPLVVSPATPSDLVRIAQIQRLSFGPTPIFQSMFGAVAPSSIDAFNVVRLTGWLKDSTAAVVKVSRGDEILGYSYWDLPSAVQETAAVVSPPREWAEGTNVAIAVDFFKRLDEHGSHIQGRHYHLHIIAVDPAYQGQGAAAAVLSWGEELARRDQLGVYLEATIAGYPVYIKRKYEVTGEPIAASDGSFDVVPMVLRPTPL